MLRIYHNPKCRKSRAGLEYLNLHAGQVEVIDYLKNPLKAEELEKLLVKLNKKPTDVVRTQEDYYRQHLKGKKFEDHEWIRILVQNPKLLQRPIVEARFKAVIGDPAENIGELLKRIDV